MKNRSFNCLLLLNEKISPNTKSIIEHWAENYKIILSDGMDIPYDFYIADHLAKPIIKNKIEKPGIVIGDFDPDKLSENQYHVREEDINCSLLNIFKHKVIEEFNYRSKLIEEEILYKNLFHESLDPILIADIKGNIKLVNKAFKELFGPNAKAGKTMFQDLFPENIVSKVINAINVGLPIDNMSVKVEFENLNLEGMLNVVPIKDNNKNITGFHALYHDNTITKKAEKVLNRVKKISMTSRMARAMAHEIRNPITNVNLALEQLVESHEGTDDEFDLYTDMIKRNTERINLLIDKLLKSSNPEKINSKQLINPEKVIMDSFKTIQDRIQLKDIKYSLDINPEKQSKRINGNEERLEIAFNNLLINAIEAIEHDHGKVSITSNVFDSKFFIILEDNGKGMTNEEQEHLFDPFYTNKKQGVGLGMTTVHTIIQEHNGSIDLTSMQGRGTKFVICLPVAE
ncbi:two-component system sensor histidine kinase NtrB [Marinigracilibium pacificum]|uniref:histidine kinase n=1 Tax=Marinigracilibium pacificum TaxID=2729599 RepID=A0A848J118_9BACT|nr:ATP-binding protein [Marinigracilibium pacificum]NMM47989.1 PAS domain S-box protein [Marinigracilibium pacificum]